MCSKHVLILSGFYIIIFVDFHFFEVVKEGLYLESYTFSNKDVLFKETVRNIPTNLIFYNTLYNRSIQ